MLSIIIPTFNRNELLELGLASISKQVMPCEHEIIVLNEYVDDESRAIAEKYNARYILTRPNLNINTISWRCPGVAINHGVKQAKGEYIIIACPEMWHADENNIKNLITPLLTGERIITHANCLDDRNSSILNAVKAGATPNLGGLPELVSEFPFFLAMHKRDFIAIGGYDMDFQEGFAYDDTNFTQRMKNSGAKYVRVDGTIVHLFHHRLRYNVDGVRRLWQRNKDLFEARLGAVVANEGKEWGNL